MCTCGGGAGGVYDGLKNMHRMIYCQVSVGCLMPTEFAAQRTPLLRKTEIEKLLHLLLASCQTEFLSSLRLCTNKL